VTDTGSDPNEADDAGTDPVSVTVYTREGCSLCVTAAETVDRVAQDLPVDVDVSLVDVDEDPDLAAAYGDRVPYVLVDDRPAFTYEVKERELRLKLLAAA